MILAFSAVWLGSPAGGWQMTERFRHGDIMRKLFLLVALARMFLPPVAEEQHGVLQIGALEIPQLDDAQTVENGLLTLAMVGGR